MYNFVISSFFLYALVFVLIQNVIARKRGASNIQTVQYPLFPLYQSTAIILITIGVLTMKDSNLTNLVAVRFVGIAVCVAGLWLSMRAQYELGKFWAGGIGLHKGHKLLTDGVYRYVRHPLYTGMLVSAIGLCLVSLNPFYGLGCLVYAGAYALRAPHEDAMLERKFKKKYLTYAENTGAIWPRFRKRG